MGKLVEELLMCSSPTLCWRSGFIEIVELSIQRTLIVEYDPLTRDLKDSEESLVSQRFFKLCKGIKHYTEQVMGSIWNPLR